MSKSDSKLTLRKSHTPSKLEKEKVLQKILECQQEILEIDEKSIIFQNQEEAANKIWERFKNKKKLMILALGMTQSGKTGVMCACVKKFTSAEENFVPVKNIFIITGLSSREWTRQTKKECQKFYTIELFTEIICMS